MTSRKNLDFSDSNDCTGYGEFTNYKDYMKKRNCNYHLGYFKNEEAVTIDTNTNHFNYSSKRPSRPRHECCSAESDRSRYFTRRSCSSRTCGCSAHNSTVREIPGRTQKSASLNRLRSERSGHCCDRKSQAIDRRPGEWKPRYSLEKQNNYSYNTSSHNSMPPRRKRDEDVKVERPFIRDYRRVRYKDQQALMPSCVGIRDENGCNSRPRPCIRNGNDTNGYSLKNCRFGSETCSDVNDVDDFRHSPRFETSRSGHQSNCACGDQFMNRDHYQCGHYESKRTPYSDHGCCHGYSDYNSDNMTHSRRGLHLGQRDAGCRRHNFTMEDFHTNQSASCRPSNMDCSQSRHFDYMPGQYSTFSPVDTRYLDDPCMTYCEEECRSPYNDRDLLASRMDNDCGRLLHSAYTYDY